MLRLHEEDGALAPLIIMYAAVAAGMILAGIDASAAFLAARNLSATADGAAAAAAQAVDPASLYAGGGGGDLPLSAAAVARVVGGYLGADPGVTWRATVSPDGRTVTVELAERAALPVGGPLLRLAGPAYADGRVPVVVTASARAPIG